MDSGAAFFPVALPPGKTTPRACCCCRAIGDALRFAPPVLQNVLCFGLQRLRSWCRPKPRSFCWFSSKENRSLRSLSGHSNCQTTLSLQLVLERGGTLPDCRHRGHRLDARAELSVVNVLSVEGTGLRGNRA